MVCCSTKIFWYLDASSAAGAFDSFSCEVGLGLESDAASRASEIHKECDSKVF